MFEDSTPQHALDIVRPGHPTLHVGPFKLETLRDHWTAALRMQMHCTAHVEGTTLVPAPFNPDYDPQFTIDPYGLSDNAHELAKLMRDDEGGDGTGRHFPDLYARLLCQYGDRRAKYLYQQAGMILEEEAAFDRRRQETVEAAATIIACMNEAERQFMQALAALDGVTDRCWGIDGEFDGQDVGDVGDESDIARRCIRNIIRNMQCFQARTAAQQKHHDQVRRTGTATS